MQKNNPALKWIVGIVIIALLAFFVRLFFLMHKNNASTTPSSAINTDSLNAISIYSFFDDFENNAYASTEKALSGEKSVYFNTNFEYGGNVSAKLNKITSFEELKTIYISFYSYSKVSGNIGKCVFSVEDANGKSVHWEAASLYSEKTTAWEFVSINFAVPDSILQTQNVIKIYIWNEEKKEFFVDDLTCKFINQTTKKSDTNNNINLYYDFESAEHSKVSPCIKQGIAHSGKYAVYSNKRLDYPININTTGQHFLNDSITRINSSVWVYPYTDDATIYITFSITDSYNKMNNWQGRGSEFHHFPKNKWTKINVYYEIPLEIINPSDKISIAVWNKGKQEALLDDFELVYGTGVARKKLNPDKTSETYVYYPTAEAHAHKTTNHLKNNISSKDELLAGNFDVSNETDELICIKESSIELFSFFEKTNEFKKTAAIEKSETSAWGKQYIRFAGDFNNDNIADVLAIHKDNNTWQLLNFKNNSWSTLIEGKSKLSPLWTKKESNPFVTSLFSSNGQKEIVVTDNLNYYTLQLNNTDLVEIKKQLYSSVKQYFLPASSLYEGNYFSSSEKQFLWLNSDWRFDFKLIEKQKNNYNITHRIDFKGYEKDYNPKYYEFTKIIPGNFLNKNKTSLLIISCNCKDENFDSKNCTAIEQLNDLPNTIQFYSFTK